MPLSADLRWRGWGFVPALVVAAVLVSCGDAEETPESPSPPALTAQPTASFSPAPTLPPYPPECQSRVGASDGVVLATQILSASSAEPILDRTQRDGLASEIDGVLSGIREDWPVVQKVHAFPKVRLGHLTVGTEGELASAVKQALGQVQSVGSIQVGVDAFDALNERLRLRGLSVYSSAYSSDKATVYLCFDDVLNLPVVASLYRGLSGVTYAQSDGSVGDGPDIAVKKQGPAWYVVFRDAFGDCVAGCIGQKLYYFIAAEGSAHQVEERVALSDPLLRSLAETWGAQRLPTSFPPTGGRP